MSGRRTSQEDTQRLIERRANPLYANGHRCLVLYRRAVTALTIWCYAHGIISASVAARVLARWQKPDK